MRSISDIGSGGFRRRVWTAFLLAAWSSLLGGQIAAEEPAYDRNGPYLALAGTFGVPLRLDEAVDTTLPDPTPTREIAIEGVDAEGSIGFHARAGYRFHSRAAAEIHFEYLDEFNVTARDGQRPEPLANASIISVEAWTLTADLKAFLLTGRVQPYGVLGLGLMDSRTKPTSVGGVEGQETPVVADAPEGQAFVGRMGVGLDMYLSPHFLVSVDATYVLPAGSLQDLQYLSFGWGFQYRF